MTGLSVYAGGSEANGCAVTTVEPSGNSYIVLQAAISPTPPTIPGALLWWSGASRDQTVPTRAGVSRQYATSRAVTCAVGDSSVTMWVYVLDFDVRVPGVGDDVEDDTPAELYVNSDDDNGNSQDDRSDSPVSGEDDLYEVVVTIEPEGAPAGTLDLEWYSTGEQPYSDDIALWEDRNKTDEADTSYTVGSGAPDSVWVEGLVVSTNEGDEHLKITYSWGSAELSDTVHFTVLPRGGISGSSGATLKLYSNESLTTEASSPAAGILYPVLEVTVGEGERLSSTTAPLILRDDWRHYFTGTEVALGLDDALSPDGGWKKWDPVEEEWATDSGPVGSDNKDGSEPLRYRAILAEWNTMQQPLGNNGDHSVFLGKEVDDEWEVAHLEFEEWEVGTGWTNAYEIEPEPISIATSNLCITDCTASNGTIDYFKWDPDGDASLAQPHITFTIVDPDPHKYTVVVRYRETMGEGTWNWDTGGWSWYKADVQDDLTVDLNLTSPGYDQECLNADDNPWGTYTYDLLVMEYDGPTPAWVQANAIDWQFLKRYRDGYHLWVPENLPSPHGDEPGHEVWTEVPENGDAGLRGFYCLESDWGAQEAQVVRGQDAQIVIVDPELEERSSTSGPAAVATLGADYGTADADSDGELDGLPLYTYQDDDPAGTWRGIFMANDNGGVHSPKWRTHEPVRMLTANQTTKLPWLRMFMDETFQQASAEAHVEWSFVGRALRAPAYIKYTLNRTGAYVGNFNDTLQNPIPEDLRASLRARPTGHVVLLGEWQSAGASIQRNDLMTAGTLKGKDGTVDSPERCGIITFNFNEFLSEPHEEDWDTVAYYTKILTHEIVHACQEDSSSHCQAVDGSWCIMVPEGTWATHGHWIHGAATDRAFYGCSLGNEWAHRKLIYAWVGEHTK